MQSECHGGRRDRQEALPAMRITKAGQAVVNRLKEENKGLKKEVRELKKALREKESSERSKDRTIEKLGGKTERQAKTIKDQRSLIAKLERRLRYHEGPSAPGVKNRADRKRDGEARKREEAAAAAREGTKKRRPGAQPGHTAHRREYKPTRRVVIDEGDDRACKDEECDGEREITGYKSRIVVERRPRPAPDVIEAHCPKSRCRKCGLKWTATRGTAVPLHMFVARKGDPAPDAAEPGQAAAAPDAADPGPSQGGIQAPPAPLAAPRAATHAGMEVNWTRVNDIPDSRDEAFFMVLPRRGAYGPNEIADAVMNWFRRMPYRMIQGALEEGGTEMAIGTISNLVAKSGDALMPNMIGIVELLRRARKIHMDKTAYRVNGKRWSLWVFYDPDNKNAAYWMTQKGDRDAIEEVLGDWDGIVICDGARAFDKYRRKQRCWAHILRESHYIQRNNPENKRARYVDYRLGKIFRDAGAFKGTPEERKRKRYELARRVRDLAYEYGGDPALREFAVTLLNAAFDLFLFVVEPDVAPTNNPAEQLLREPVILRKIRGSLRATRSAMVMCALLSCMTTWKMQGLDPIAELKKAVCAPAPPRPGRR